MGRIYFDHHSTTPVDPRVLEVMLPYFTERFGNAASRTHAFGAEASKAAETAREQVAALIGADPSEIVFTSGATESDNLALKGVVATGRGGHVVTVATEHPAVLDPCRALERDGKIKLAILPVRPDGLIDVDAFRRALTDGTAVASVMFANNEIGTIQPIADLGAICREKGVLFHTDAAQACGKVEVDVEKMNIDLLSLTAHKMYGPKGVGALYVRRRKPRVRLVAQMDGGGHENGLRSGTLPVALVAGFGKACELSAAEMKEEAPRVLALRERLRTKILERIDQVKVNGTLEPRLPGNLNLSFAHVEGESLILSMGDVAASTGSACASAKLEPSAVLHALGVDEPLARASVRFGLGRFNTEPEVDRVVDLLVKAVGRLRELSPLYEGPAK